MKKSTLSKVVRWSAIGVDVACPLIATLSQFPIWINRSGEATVSGTFLLFALLSCIPFLKQIKAYIKSPSAWMIWAIPFVSFIALRNIIDEMIIICFVGLISNIAGTFIYKAGEKIGGGDKE
jgi:hypothetical protein